ncbi:MAG TPA: hypothetical protein VEA99_08275 [Gemmatimonadaceae bacterium]|nr:hypothetical protein [Gemmatimonadaceae bacterium]
MTETLYINGAPAELWGLQVANASRWRDTGRFRYETARRPLDVGLDVLEQGSSVDEASVGLRFLLTPATVAARRALVDALTAALVGVVEVSSLEDPTKIRYCRLLGATYAPVGKALVNAQTIADVEFVAFDPRWWDRDPQVVHLALASPRSAVPMGSAPTRRLQLVLVGPFTAPTVTLYDAAGRAIQQMRFSADSGWNLTASMWGLIDCERGLVQEYASGVWVDRTSTLHEDDTFFSLRQPAAHSIGIAGGGAGAGAHATIRRGWY